jgi:hypothetical protein
MKETDMVDVWQMGNRSELQILNSAESVRL